MDEFKPEDELKPDPSDRRTGRFVNRLNAIMSRKSILMMLIWILTIVVQRARVKNVTKSKTLKKTMNLMTIPWMKSV